MVRRRPCITAGNAGKDIFIQMMEGLAVPEAAEHKTIMIDATYLKAHRTASSLRVKKGARAA